jgi:hypothetical protein
MLEFKNVQYIGCELNRSPAEFRLIIFFFAKFDDNVHTKVCLGIIKGLLLLNWNKFAFDNKTHESN